MQELSSATKSVVTRFAIWQKSLKPKEGITTIHVDEVASKVSAFYEQIRTIIDWKEEHLMRRSAIIRKLKSRFLDLELSNFEKQNVAEGLVLELIRGGFFPNDKIAESKIQDVQNIIDKYVFILKNTPENNEKKSSSQFYTRLLEIAACEIEETLAPSIKEMALIDFMFTQMKERIRVSEKVYASGILKPEETDIQIYIAVQEALFKLDDPIISYNVIKYKYQQWNHPSEDELLRFAQNIYKILQSIEQELNHPLARKFYTICEKYDTPYLLLGDILIKENPEKIAQEIYDPVIMEGFIRGAYAKRLKDLKAKINRAAIYSTLSIFITKILALVILEWILAILLHEKFNAAFLAADILIPTGLMAFLVASVKLPSKKNLNFVVIESMKIIYQKDKTDTYEIRGARQRGVITRAVLSLIYLAGACVSFGAIYIAFNYFQFPISSIIVNIIFIALILFAGSAVRSRSRELSMEDENEGVTGFISDILFLPLMGVGKWMSTTWKQYNAISAILNALIDMPFGAFVEFLERWRYFIKDKKEEMR